MYKLLKGLSKRSIKDFGGVNKIHRLQFCENKANDSQESKEHSPEEYENTWTKEYLNKRQQVDERIKSEMTDYQTQEVEFVKDKLLEMSLNERKYWAILIRRKTKNLLDCDLFKDISTIDPNNLKSFDNVWPPQNPDWYKTEDLENTLNAFSGRAQGVKGNCYIINNS